MGNIRPALLILQAAAILVLFIAIVNIANLLLARASARGREIGIRVAIGASRVRVFRQFLTESLLLGFLGGAAGVLLAKATLGFIIHLGSATIPRLEESRIDGTALAFSLVSSIVAAILFGLAPLLSSWKPKLNEVLKEGTQNASVDRRSLQFRGLLITGEIALAIILVTGAGLILKSFWRMNELPSNFHPEKILTMRVSLPPASYQSKSTKEAYFRNLLRSLEAAPGVEAAGFESGAITMAGPRNPYHERMGGVKFTAVSAGYL